MPPDYRARAEQVILFIAAAWDANIPQRFKAADVAAALAAKDQQIASLTAALAALGQMS